MSVKLVTVLLSGVLAGALVPSASFAKNHDEPGTPGEPNCEGQTTAYLNQTARGFDPPVHGIGNIAEAFFGSVQDLHAAVDEFCNPPPGP